MLLSFEGIDGSGKSTQISLLKNYLTDRGFRVEVFREPGGTDLSEYVRSLLLDSSHNIDPVTELLLFSSARSQLVAEKVLPLLRDGTIVILDRYYDSTTAYQGYGRNSLPIDQIQEINQIASHERAPDCTFYLRVSLQEAQRRTAKQQKDRMERAGDEFYKKVIAGFDKLAETEDRFVTIDSTISPEHTHKKVKNHVIRLIEGK